MYYKPSKVFNIEDDAYFVVPYNVYYSNCTGKCRLMVLNRKKKYRKSFSWISVTN